MDPGIHLCLVIQYPPHNLFIRLRQKTTAEIKQLLEYDNSLGLSAADGGNFSIQTE
jgi:hypothetical protein